MRSKKLLRKGLCEEENDNSCEKINKYKLFLYSLLKGLYFNLARIAGSSENGDIAEANNYQTLLCFSK